MTSYIALLRAVNVGGTGKLPMTHLKTMCEDAGQRRSNVIAAYPAYFTVLTTRNPASRIC